MYPCCCLPFVLLSLASPSVDPTVSPSYVPSTNPSAGPTTSPSTLPSNGPSVNPTVAPSVIPSTSPSCSPSTDPTVNPSTSPSQGPSVVPSGSPTVQPTVTPSTSPSVGPTVDPTVCPTTRPSGSPTPREEISIDISVEAWEFFTLGDHINEGDHTTDQLVVIQTTDVGSFLLNSSALQVSDSLSDSDLPLTSYSPEVVAENVTTVFVIEGDYKRYTFTILVIHPDACVGEWSDYTDCSVTCDEGT